MQLQPVSYHLNRDQGADPLSFGFIAQDVYSLFPELTSPMRARDGNTYLTVNYAGFSVVTVKAIQEQQEKIQTLQQENADLKAQLESLDARLQKLEKSGQ